MTVSFAGGHGQCRALAHEGSRLLVGGAAPQGASGGGWSWTLSPLGGGQSTTLGELGLHEVEKPHSLSSIICFTREAGALGQSSDGPSAQDPPLLPTSVCLAEKGLDIYLIIGICGGGVLFLLFVALLILYASKRRKAHRRRNGKLPPLSPRGRAKSPWKQLGGTTLEWGREAMETGSFRMSGLQPAVTVCSILWLA